MVHAPTGDLNNSIHKLKTELLAVAFDQHHLDLDGVMRGSPVSILPLLHYALLEFSQPLASYLISRGMYDMYAKTDTQFLESVWRVCRDEFKYRPVLTRDQFLAGSKYVERKIMFVTDFVRECRKKHDVLSRKSIRGTTLPSKGQKSSANKAVCEKMLGSTEGMVRSESSGNRRSAFTRVSGPVQEELNYRKVEREIAEVEDSIDIAPTAHPVSSLRSARQKYIQTENSEDEDTRGLGVHEETIVPAPSWPVRGTLWSYLVPNTTTHSLKSVSRTGQQYNPQWYCNASQFQDRETYNGISVPNSQPIQTSNSRHSGRNDISAIQMNDRNITHMEYGCEIYDDSGSHIVHDLDSRIRPRPPPLHPVPPFETYISLNPPTEPPSATTTTSTGSQQSSPLQRYGTRAVASFHHHHSKMDPHVFTDGQNALRPAKRHDDVAQGDGYRVLDQVAMFPAGSCISRLEIQRDEKDQKEDEGQGLGGQNVGLSDVVRGDKDFVNEVGTENGTMPLTIASKHASPEEIGTILSRISAHLNTLNTQIQGLNNRMSVIETHLNFARQEVESQNQQSNSLERFKGSTPPRKSAIPVPVLTCKARKRWDIGIKGNDGEYQTRDGVWRHSDEGNSEERENHRENVSNYEGGEVENGKVCVEDQENSSQCPSSPPQPAAGTESPSVALECEKSSSGRSILNPSNFEEFSNSRNNGSSDLHPDFGPSLNTSGTNTGQLIQNISERFRVTRELLRESIGS